MLFSIDLYSVLVCIFVIYILHLYFPYCLFVRNSQVIGCVGRLQKDLYCVEWDVKRYSTNRMLTSASRKIPRSQTAVYGVT